MSSSSKLNFVVVFIAITALCSAQDFLTIVQVPFSETLNLKKNEIYKYALSFEKVQNEDYITVSASSLTKSDILLSFDSKDLENRDKINSWGTNGDLMIITPDHRQNKGSGFLSITCRNSEDDCSILIDITVTPLFQFSADDENIELNITNPSDATAAIVRVYIPEQKDGDRILFYSEAIPQREDARFYFNMFVGKGDDIPYGKHEELPSVGGFYFLSEADIIYKDHEDFCTGCVFTITVAFPKYSSVLVAAHVFSAVEDIDLDSQLIDGITQDSGQNNYVLIADENSEIQDIHIYITPMLNDVYLNVTCMDSEKKKPLKLSYHIEKSEDIIISKKEHEGCKANKYKVIVYTDDFSAMYFLATRSEDAAITYINEESEYTGIIKPGESKTFVFYFLFQFVELSIVKYSSNGVIKAEVNKCLHSVDCPGLALEDFKMNYTHKLNLTKDLGTGLRITNDSILLMPHADSRTCYPLSLEYLGQSFLVCAYNLVISSLSHEDVMYKLSQKQYGHWWLIPGEPSFGKVEGYDSEDYVLLIPNPNKTEIILQLTYISGNGNCVLNASPENKKKAGAKDQVKVYKSEIGHIHITSKDEKLYDRYYINVVCSHLATFTLLATVHDSAGNSLDSSIYLEEGQIQKGTLIPNGDMDEHYYKFDINLDPEWVGSIEIQVTSFAGKLEMGVSNDGTMPFPPFAKWTSKDHILVIRSTDIDFKSRGTYSVGVFPDMGDPDTMYIEEIIYSISYSVVSKKKNDNTITVLATDSTFKSTLSPMGIKYFKFTLPQTIESFSVYLKSDSSLVNAFLSLDEENRYPDATNNDISTLKTLNSRIYINSTFIQEHCSKIIQSIRSDCNGYLSVISTSQNDSLRYMINLIPVIDSAKEKNETFPLNNKTIPIQLLDGVEYESLVPAENKPLKFYYFFTANNHGILELFAGDYDAKILCNLNGWSIKDQAFSLMNFPDEIKYDLSAYEKNSENYYTLRFDPISGYNTTVATISVYFTSSTERHSANQKRDEFKIMASSSISELFAGITTFGVIGNDTYRYYSFKVDSDDAVILASISNFEGKVYTYISKGSQKRPTIDSYDFAIKSSHKSEWIEIGPKDIFPIKSMRGDWVIGINGKESINFFYISVYTQENKIVELSKNTPQQIFVKKNKGIFLKYYHKERIDLTLRFSVQAGEFVAYIDTIISGEDIISFMPSKNIFEWKYDSIEKTRFVPEFSIGVHDPEFCWNCNYIMYIETDEIAEFVVQVILDELWLKFENGVTYQEELAQGEIAHYSFFSPQSESVALSISSSGGHLRIFASHNPTLNSTNYVWTVPHHHNVDSYFLEMKGSDYESIKSQAGIFDGIKMIPSNPSIYYVIIENDAKEANEISIVFNARYMPINIVDGVTYPGYIPTHGSETFLFSSASQEENVQIILEFNIDTEEFMHVNHGQKGLIFSGRFRSEKASAGDRAVIFDYSTISAIGTADEGKTTKAKQEIWFVSKYGKYEFLLTNKFKANVKYSVSVKTILTEKMQLNVAQEYTLEVPNDNPIKLELIVRKSGVLYIDLHKCWGDIDVEIGESKESIDTQKFTNYKVQNIDSYFHMMEASAGNDPVIKIKAIKDSHLATTPLLYFKANEFHGKLDINLEGFRAGSITSIEKDENWKLKIKIDKVYPDLPEPDFTLDYRIAVCKSKASAEKLAYCGENDNTKECSYDFGRNPGASLQLSSKTSEQENYYISAAAIISYKQAPLKTILYDTKNIVIFHGQGEFRIGDSNNYEKLIYYSAIIVLAGLVICLGFYCYRKLGNKIEERGFEMTNVPKKYTQFDLE